MRTPCASRSPNRWAISAAAAAPARCINAREGTPESIAAASHADAPAASTTATRDRRRFMRACECAPDNARRLLLRCADGAPVPELAVVDPDVEPALGVAAHPCLVGDGRPVAAVVAEG